MKSLRADYEKDVEIIVVNDGSNDSSNYNKATGNENARGFRWFIWWR